MKRGDMPAQAQSIAWSEEYNEAVTAKTHLDDSYVPHSEGLTIREELAARADVMEIFRNYFTNYKKMCDFVGVPEFDFSHTENCIGLEMMTIAKLRAMNADALLAELAKGGEDE